MRHRRENRWLVNLLPLAQGPHAAILIQTCSSTSVAGQPDIFLQDLENKNKPEGLQMMLPFPLSRMQLGGFSGGAVVESLPANAGDAGSSPGLGGSHVTRSNWAHEPQLLSLRVWSLCSATREATIMRGPRAAMKSGPHLPQLEKALAQKRRPNTAIK